MKKIFFVILILIMFFNVQAKSEYPSTPKPEHIEDTAILIATYKNNKTSVSVTSKSGWHINTAAPLNLTLGDVRVDISSAKLTNPGQWANEMEGVSWEVDGPYTETGILVVAFCTDKVCFPPTKETIKIKKL